MKSLFDFGTQNLYESKDFRYITEESGLEEALNKIKDSKIIYLDTEVDVEDFEKINPFKDRLRLIQIGNDEHIFIIDVFKVNREKIKEFLKNILPNVGVVGHNIKFDLKFIYLNFGVLPRICFDTMIASQIISKGNDADKHSLKAVVGRHTGQAVDKTFQKSNWGAENLSQQQLQYASDDIKVLRQLFRTMIEKLNSGYNAHLSGEIGKYFGLKNPIAGLEMAFLPVLVEIELSGMPVNIEHLDNLLGDTEKRFQSLYFEFKRKTGIDPFSQQQLTNYLIKTLGINLPQTEKGTYSSQESVLRNYIQHDEIRSIIEIRTLKKSVDKLKEIKSYIYNGRVYTEFKQIAAPTGRMASLKPNLQNIPSNLKDVFKTDENHSFIIADYSQIELRIAAEYTKDENMIDAFIKGKDLHRLTASIITGKNYDDISSQERKLAKAINFGLIYGMSPKSLVEYAKANYDIDISMEDAKEFHKNFFTYFTGFLRWHNFVKEYLKNHKVIEVQTLFGRKILANRFTDAVNYPIQGSGTDLLKMAVVFFYRDKDNSSQVVNLVHDEIVLESEDISLEKNKKILSNSMEKAGKFILKKVPVEFEINTGKIWSKG